MVYRKTSEMEVTAMSGLKLKILALLKEDSRRPAQMIADLLDISQDEVNTAIRELERDKVIVKYSTIVNWNKVDEEKVTALIEVKVTPERGRGFDALAERIYLFPEVKSVMLVSGAYDLLVEIEGRSLKEVASFVSEKLSPLESVLSTATHFILKKYKQDGITFEDDSEDHRIPVSP
jgi:DNA-binding Lrp family transcriptional regulator